MIHLEVRKKIVQARLSGKTIAEICQLYDVKATAVSRLLRMERETGSIVPRTYMRGRKPALSKEDLARMRTLLLEKPTITLAEIKETMHLTISISAISVIIRKKLGFCYRNHQYHLVESEDKRDNE